MADTYSGDEEIVEFDCPHCGQGFTMKAGDALFTDHVRDECSEKCTECGGEYQLRCARVDIEMECTKYSDGLEE